MVEQDLSVLEKLYCSIYKYLSSSAEKYATSIHVSDLIYSCVRRAYYGKMRSPIIDIASAIRMAVGKAFHEVPFAGSKAHELELEWEGIVGHIDEYLEDGTILDKKVVRTAPDRPHEHHVKQVEMYAVIASQNGYEVKKLALLYIAIGENPPKAVCYSWQPLYDPYELMDEMRWKRDALKQAIISGQPPPRVVSWECGYCGYCAECFSSPG